MSIEAAIDKTALKVAAIAGIKAAYGSAAYDSSVPFMVEDIPDTPVALVTLGDGTVHPGNWERLDYGIDVLVYVGSSDLGAAYKMLAPFPVRFIQAWRSDMDLGQTVTASHLVGWTRPEPVELNGKPFLVLRFHTAIIEADGASYAV